MKRCSLTWEVSRNFRTTPIPSLSPRPPPPPAAISTRTWPNLDGSSAVDIARPSGLEDFCYKGGALVLLLAVRKLTL